MMESAPQRNVCHQSDVSIAIDGFAICCNHCAAVHISVKYDPQVRPILQHHAASCLHSLPVLWIWNVIWKPAIAVQKLTAYDSHTHIILPLYPILTK